jgi:spore coat polysaccharide biosynthesis predicted glycosyltransferase SpsG
LREAVAEHGGEVAAALAAAGAAVSAAGTSAWELLCLGVPAALVVVADDQRLPAALIDAARAAVVLGPVDEALAGGLAGLEALLDPVERDRLSAAGRALVDGRGPERVVEVLCS